eukprot:CAMPEP_0202887272 /NCGR_PEP_ID=MMETSP1391-20130828/42601_1 /ASSEMBLY_ACC=CAM_ASM_000867 /TAXON_ID=1034604 /ORGANISM="Chlamydomonas leiostraca, Strain SAG 11-49" /LENGTH=165 /DNA_ID=CAMNT_0049570557 /DNA_START=41 /DNA_END=539 /DNA_ORIENTATION=-
MITSAHAASLPINSLGVAMHWYANATTGAGCIDMECCVFQPTLDVCPAALLAAAAARAWASMPRLLPRPYPPKCLGLTNCCAVRSASNRAPACASYCFCLSSRISAFSSLTMGWKSPSFCTAFALLTSSSCRSCLVLEADGCTSSLCEDHVVLEPSGRGATCSSK